MSRPVDPSEENPFEAPKSGEDIDATSNLYVMSIRRLSTKELWNTTPNWSSFVILWVVKTLGLKLSTNSANLRGEDLIEVPYDSIPEANRESIREAEEDCREAGLIRQHAYRLPIVAPGPPNVGVTYATPDGKVLARLISVWNRGIDPWVTASFSTLSRKADGGWLISSNMERTDEELPGGIEPRNTPGQSFRELLDDHRQWAEERADEIEPIPADEMLAAESSLQKMYIEFFIERGSLVPMSRKEAGELMTLVESTPLEPSKRAGLATRLALAEAFAMLALIVVGTVKLLLNEDTTPRVVSDLALYAVIASATAWVGLTIARRIVSRSDRSESAG